VTKHSLYWSTQSLRCTSISTWSSRWQVRVQVPLAKYKYKYSPFMYKYEYKYSGFVLEYKYQELHLCCVLHWCGFIVAYVKGPVQKINCEAQINSTCCVTTRCLAHAFWHRKSRDVLCRACRTARRGTLVRGVQGRRHSVDPGGHVHFTFSRSCYRDLCKS